jgi:MFS family permease
MTAHDDEESGARSSEDHVPLRRNRNFRLLWIGQVLSDLGSTVGAIAYPLLVLELTHSAVIAGLVASIASVAAFIVRLPAGALADRIDRRRVMIVCDASRACVLGVLTILVALNVASWPVVLVAAVVDRLGDTLFSPASTAVLPTIVHSRQLEDAWAATEARQYTANLAGPALGGALFGLGKALPFLGDTLSYGVSTFTSARMTGEFMPTRTADTHVGLWREALDGIKLLWHDPLLRAVIVQAPLINFMFTGVLFAVTLSLRVHGSSGTAIGLAQSVIMVGGLLGAIVAPRIQGRFTLWQLVVALTGSATVFLAIAAGITPSPWIAIPIAVPFFVSPTTNAGLFAAMLRRTPEEMRGRVNNALLQLATGLAALAPIAAGVLVTHLSAAWVMGAFAAGMALCTLLTLALPGLRTAGQRGLEKPPADVG